MDSARFERFLLVLFISFTGLSIAGFALFSTPLGLSVSAVWLSESELLRSIHAMAYPVFAQMQVGLSFVVLLWYMATRIGWPAFSTFVLIASVTFLVEWLGTSTGWPFGQYAYGASLGPRIAGRVPIWVPVSWFTVAIPAYAMALDVLPGEHRRWRRLMLGAFFVMLWDVLLDPAMSGVAGYWTWSAAGPFFGMPLQNLLGWYLTGAVLMLVIDMLGGIWWGGRLSTSMMQLYYGGLLALPAGMLLAVGEWGPLVIVAVLMALAVSVRSFTRPRDAAVAIATEPAKTIDKDSARDYFWAHSRSFSFASLAFPAANRRLVGLVYAFCRITDDIVDEAKSGRTDARRRLQQWLLEARSAYFDGRSSTEWLDELMQVSSRKRVPFEVIEDLVRGVEHDVDPPSFQTVDQLKDYCYGVASTVGLWLCHLHDVRDDWMLSRAAALGRAMQITNIVRDVGEDLDRGRLYLPADVLDRVGITRADIEEARRNGSIPDGYEAAIREMIAVADAEYARAWEAIPLLPNGFAAPAAIAADVYRAIQGRVEKNGWNNLTRRARTSLPLKVMLATRAWLRLKWRRTAHRFGNRRVVAAAFGITLAAVQMPAPALAGVGASTLARLRSLYVDAGTYKEAVDEAHALIEGLGDDEKRDPVVEAYGAAFEVVRAKYAFWPFSKLKHVRRGLPVLDRLVETHPDELEIRFLRLVSCYHLPGIMGRKDTVRADLTVLCDTVASARQEYPTAWLKRMVSFVLGTSDIAPESRREMQALLSELNAEEISVEGGVQP